MLFALAQEPPRCKHFTVDSAESGADARSRNSETDAPLVQTQIPESSTRMTVAPLYVNGITIALQTEIRLADLQRLIAIGEYMRQLLEYRRLTQYWVRGRRD